MGAYLSTCAICAAEFRADASQKPAYDAALMAADKVEAERLLGVINAQWALQHHMQAEHADAMFVCGRQNEGIGAGRGPQGFWEADHTCSYCGSLSPEKFFEAVEAGCEVGPTDKNYKAYIDIPNAEPDAVRVMGSSNGMECPGPGWVKAPEVDDETLARSNWSRPPADNWLLLGKNGATKNAKFYFQHLDQAGQDHFIALFKEKRMKIGYPGHFYSRPYFCEPAPAAS